MSDPTSDDLKVWHDIMADPEFEMLPALDANDCTQIEDSVIEREIDTLDQEDWTSRHWDLLYERARARDEIDEGWAGC